MPPKKLAKGLTKMHLNLQNTKCEEIFSLCTVILPILVTIVIVLALLHTDTEDLSYFDSKIASKLVNDTEILLAQETENVGTELTKSNNEGTIKMELNKEIQADKIRSTGEIIKVELNKEIQAEKVSTTQKEEIVEHKEEIPNTTVTKNMITNHTTSATTINGNYILPKTDEENETSVNSNDTSINLNDVMDENTLTNATLTYLREAIKCQKKNAVYHKFRKGDYWLFENFVKANHGDLECYGHVTLATHSGLRYLDNLEIVVQRWLGPISVSMYAPGTDFSSSVDTIQYLRECSPQKDLIKHWVTFHLFFPSSHFPQAIPKMGGTYDCSLPPPYANKTFQTYKEINNLTYPINIGRNLARDAALTHYVLSVDIELYPSPSLGYKFLNMLARNTSLVEDKKPRVFILKPFEIEKGYEIPENKTELLKLFKNKTLIPFHTFVCKHCHNTPLSEQWIDQGETEIMDITGVGSRTGPFSRWEPVFIGTKDDPRFEEQLSWDGMRDKMAQAYLLCVHNYEILILSNAFLVHNLGIHRTYPISDVRKERVKKQNQYIDKVLHKEYDVIYGTRPGCVL